MIHRHIPVLLALALAASACAYESSGTTTTTTVDPDAMAPLTGPADLVFRDQLTDGGSVLLESVSLPEPGFVVLYDDQEGSPGNVIGATRILSAGVIANVPVPFFVPIEGAATVHAQVHIDMDRDEAFTYEPPDAFVDVPATFANGEVAAMAATVTLLPPTSPAVVTFAEQRTTGETLEILEVDLPAPGFVVLREDDQGEPGRIIGISELLPAGITSSVVIQLDDKLGISMIVFATIYIDRDSDGVLALGEDAVDAIAQGADGLDAAVSVPVTAVPLGPVTMAAADQETEGGEVLATVTVPSPGFAVLSLNAAGSPGDVIGIIPIPEIGTSRLTFAIDPPLEGENRLWLTVYIDLDGDGELGPDDPVGLVDEQEPAEVSFLATVPAPDDGDDGS